MKTFLTADSGQKTESPLHMLRASTKIKTLSRHLSRKEKGSSNRKKARLNLARAHRAVANQRKDFHHKLALELVTQYDTIFVEDLDLKAMQKAFGRKISDLGHAQFLKFLSWQAEKHGKALHKIPRFEPSTRTCSRCLHKGPKLEPKVRAWTCSNCNSEHDRDINAAINIHRVGASALKGEGIRLASASSL